MTSYDEEVGGTVKIRHPKRINNDGKNSKSNEITRQRKAKARERENAIRKMDNKEDEE